MSETTVAASDVGRTCPYCRFALKAGTAAQRCDACAALHHDECWADGAGCAILGCAGGPAGQAAAATPVGASAASPPPPPPPPPSAEPGVPAAPPPPADRRRGPLIAVLAVLAAIVAGGAAFLLIAGKAGDDHGVSASSGQQQTVATTAADGSDPAAPAGHDDAGEETDPAQATASGETAEEREADIAGSLERIIDYSLEGRSAVRAGRYSAAVANRRTVLRRIRALRGASGRLAGARTTLERAMDASLASDEAYASGGDASTSDAEATRLKRVFARQWQPIAADHGLTEYGPDDI